MPSINTVCLSGRVCAQPTLTESGYGALFVPIAYSDRRRLPDGTFEERPARITCVLFGPKGGALATSVKVGSEVCVQGRLRGHEWLDEMGTRHHETEVVASELRFLGPTPKTRPAGARVESLSEQLGRVG